MASGSIVTPSASAAASTFARAASQVERARSPARSMTFSVTVIGVTSEKCWVTMPMPARDGVLAASGCRPSSPSTRDADRRRAGSGRRGCASGSSCRRRSRRAGRGPRPGEGEVHVVVGDEVAETLGDAAQLDERHGCPSTALAVRRDGIRLQPLMVDRAGRRLLVRPAW